MHKYVILFGVFGLALAAQSPAGLPEEGSSAVGSQQTTTSEAPAGSSVAPETPLSRWLTVDALSFTMRFRDSFDTEGMHIFNDIQQRSLVSGKFKFDKGGKFFVGFRAESGRYFNWAFADFSGLDYREAVATSSHHLTLPHVRQFLSALALDPQGASVIFHLSARGWEFYVRDLYVSATPVKWLTAEFGSIPIERGVSTEITSYDEDGYISGERVSVHTPEHLYLDRVTFTSAYLGDVFTPNFFDRYDRLTQSNYRQVLAEKHFGSRVKASMDYTWQDGANTLREAIQVKIPEARVVDSARLELYQRTNDLRLPGYLAHAANGWAFTGTKSISKRFNVEGGYASIDEQAGVNSGSSALAAAYFPLNGDSYQVGKRFFGRANVKVAPGTSLFGFYTHQIDSKATPLTYSFTRQNYNFGVQFDFKSMLERAHIL